MINTNLGQDMMQPYRIVSPYAMKTVRAVRKLAATINNPLVQSRLNAPLNPNNYMLYYKIEPSTEAKATVLNNWLAADTNRDVLSVPIDSLSMFPSSFSATVMDSRQSDKKTFYTTTPLSQPLPAGMGAVVIDTLYKQGDTELTLDFMLNTLSANLSDGFVASIQGKSQTLHSLLLLAVDSQYFVRESSVGGTLVLDRPHLGMVEFMKDMTGGIESDIIPGVWHPTVETGGRISFEENTLGIDEGIKNLRVTAWRFFATPYFTHTDNNGRFNSTLPSWGFVSLVHTFQNTELKIRSIDYSSSLPMDILSSIRYILRFNLPEKHLTIVKPWDNINNININFNHGSKKALWGITFNAIQEANGYAASSGIYDYSPINRKFLNVMCYYNNSTNSAAAPMLGYLGSGLGLGVTNIIGHTTGLSSLIGKTIGGLLPDMVINCNSTDPLASHEQRETIYHEYGHTRHYFKANKYSNEHWHANITHSLEAIGGSQYGTAIDSERGAFFSLSEGWADFIGHNFAFRKYGTGLEFNEYNWVTSSWHDDDNYQEHLERVPTYFNGFIPRGLFHDLMDNMNDAPLNFDRLSGHTILQMYNRFNDNTWTIQKFRENWEDEYPNVNNADLFDAYNINLP